MMSALKLKAFKIEPDKVEPRGAKEATSTTALPVTLSGNLNINLSLICD